MDTVEKLLDYFANPNAKIRYNKPNIILNIHSDLVATKAKRYAAGQDNILIKLNGPIHSLPFLLQFVTASTASVELDALLYMSKRGTHPFHF